VGASVANFLNFEQLAQVLVCHRPHNLVQEQVLVDGIQTTLDGECARLDHLADSFDVLARVLHVVKLDPVLLVKLRSVNLVVVGLH